MGRSEVLPPGTLKFSMLKPTGKNYTFFLKAVNFLFQQANKQIRAKLWLWLHKICLSLIDCIILYGGRKCFKSVNIRCFGQIILKEGNLLHLISFLSIAYSLIYLCNI